MIKWLTDDKAFKYILYKNEKVYKPNLKMFHTRKDDPWFTNRFLQLLVQWIITYSVIWPKLLSNNGKFKPGDKVKYNWKAKVQIWTVVEKKETIRTISRILYSDKSGLEFTNGDSCAAFWVRKIYFWEN